MDIRTKARLLNPTSALVTNPHGMAMARKTAQDIPLTWSPPNATGKRDVRANAKIHWDKKCTEVISNGHGNAMCSLPNTYLLYRLRHPEKKNQPSMGGKYRQWSL
mmetsp:Transcript_15875/g.18449  ORF Transcript_15875/g.18449 Transcript_15875/m.18449 type:complete len:105 (+) Transcript_15875:1104-1418(+)